MRKCAIVGAGQAGLQLAFELLEQGLDVSLYTDKDAAAVLDAPTQPVALQFAQSRAIERRLRLALWRELDAPEVDHFVMHVFTPAGERQFTIRTPLAPAAQAIDLRVKFSAWQEEFVRRGGRLTIAHADIALLETLAATHDAVFVTAGKAAFSTLFERDEEKSPLDAPRRKLVQFFARQCTLDIERPGEQRVNACNIIAESGECLFYHFMYRDMRRATVLLFEAIPGGPLDLYDERRSVRENFEAYRAYLRDACPDVYEAVAGAELIDGELLRGAITPVVRKPVGTLPSGRVVMALGDALVLHDPVCAQGLNAASRGAHQVAARIAAHPGAAFDAAWIEATFATLWETAQHGCELTNTLLTGLQPHQGVAMYAASQVPALADDLLNNCGQLERVMPWFRDAGATWAHLAGRGFAVPAAE